MVVSPASGPWLKTPCDGIILPQKQQAIGETPMVLKAVGADPNITDR